MREGEAGGGGWREEIAEDAKAGGMRDSAENDMLGHPCVARCVGGGNECWSKGGSEEGWVPSSNQQPVIRNYPRTEFFGVREKGQSDVWETQELPQGVCNANASEKSVSDEVKM